MMQRMVVAGLAFLTALTLSCSSRFDEASIDADRLCGLADTAFARQDFSELLPALEKQFHVEKKDMRMTGQGIYIPLKHRFVEEDGYFLARPGTNLILRAGDPALVRVKGCVFRYHIKG